MSSAVSHLTPPIRYSTENATPIHSLPTEVLLAVFTLVGEDDKYHAFMSMKNKCWRLGRVCHWWRVVVEGSPSFWTRLDVHLGQASILRDPTALLYHALHLTKGQGLTLFLDFEMNVHYNEDAPPFTAMDLWNILFPHAPCWWRIFLTHFDAAGWHVLSQIVGSTTLTKLKMLAITEKDPDEDFDHEDEDDDGDDSDDEYEGWLPNAPLLERLVIQGAPLDCGPFHPQLKEFGLLEVVYNISLATLLQTSSHLEVLRAYKLRPTAADSNYAPHLPINIPTRVTSSSLLHLALHQNVKDLDTVDLPNLRSLIAGDPEATSTAPYLHSFFELVRFSHPPLTRLALLNCDFESGNLVDVLRLLPLLKMFRIHFGHIKLDAEFNENINRVLSSLTSALGEVDKETGAFILVPDLEDFRIDFFDDTEVASAFEWTFYTPKVEVDFGMRQRQNGKFTGSCSFQGKLYFGVALPGSFESWTYISVDPE